MFETKEGLIKPIVYVGIVNEDLLLLVDYLAAPNPGKAGWWIPAPGLQYGEDPFEKASKLAEDLGVKAESIQLHNVESFVLPGGWHLIYHYVIKTHTKQIQHSNIRDFKWVKAQELSEMTDIAHGKWEINVGRSYLEG
jgi:hypothetical protein